MTADLADDVPAGKARSPRGFFAARWHGDVPLATLFWVEMLIWSTLLNLAMLGASVVVLESGLPLWLSIAVFASPIPWNLFLVLAIFRQADREEAGGERRWGFAAKIGAATWLVIACLV